MKFILDIRYFSVIITLALNRGYARVLEQVDRHV